MDSRQAKEILTRYRPGETATDPEVGEALELARHDPQLAAWFAAHRAAQATAPTSSDTDQIVSGQSASGARRASKKRKIVAFLAIAIGLLAVFIWRINAPRPKDPFTSYRDRMARLVQRAYPVKIAATDQAQLREYFRTNSGMAGYTLRRNLEKLPARGGAVFTWHNNPVSLLSLDAGGGTNLYVFLIKRSAFPDVAVPKDPKFGRVGNLMTASWTSNDEVCVLAGPGDETWLRGYLE